MFLVDFIIANKDRHYRNFGFLRNSETLEWIGLAPVYDSGFPDAVLTSKKMDCLLKQTVH